MALVTAKEFWAREKSGYVQPNDSSTSPKPTNVKKTKGLVTAKEFWAKEKEAANVQLDPKPPSYTYQKNEFGTTLQDLSQSPTVQRINKLSPEAPSQEPYSPSTPSQELQSPAHNNLPSSVKNNLAERVQKPNVLDKIFKDNKVMRVLNYPFAKAAEFAVPDANYFGTQINARQDNAQRNPVISTGNKTVDKVGDFVGQAGAMFVPIGGSSPVINDLSKVVSKIAGTKFGQKAVAAAGKAGAKIANIANPALNNVGINVSTDLAQKAGQNFAKGAALGGAYGVTAPYTYGSGNSSEVPKSVIENALMFGVGDAALPLLGAGFRKAQPLVDKRDFRKAITEFVQKTKDSKSDPYSGASKQGLIQGTIPSGKPNVADEIAATFNRVDKYKNQQKQAVDDQYGFLKQSMENRGGVDQGNVIKDPSTGEVIDRYGRISNNPKWYQDFFAQNGKKPSDADLRKLAEQHVKKGFADDMGQIPAWKPDDLIDIDAEITNIRELLPHVEDSTKLELRRALVDLEQSRNETQRALPKDIQPVTDKTTYEEYQRQMDAVEKELIEKYGWEEYSKTTQNQPYMWGGKLVKPEFNSKIPKDEWARYEDLNNKRDAVEKASMETEITRVTEALDYSNPHEEWLADKESVQHALDNVYRKNQFRDANKSVDVESIKKDIYNDLIQKTNAPSDLWGEFILAKKIAANEEISPLGQSMKPLLNQINDIVEQMLNSPVAKAETPKALENKPITNLDELVKSTGYAEANPKTIAKVESAHTPNVQEPRQKMQVQAPKQPQTMASATIKNNPEVQQMRNNPIPSRAANPNAVIKKPITRQQLLKNVRKNFGIVIRTGRIGDKDPNVLGIYKNRSEVVRSRHFGDIEVISHEIGHHLDKKLDLADPHYDRELQSLGQHTSGKNYTVDKIRAEGVAEFTRLYLTDPATAARVAPQFSTFFESLLTKDMKKAVAATQKDVATWIDQGPAMQFRGQVNRTGREANGKSVSERLDDVYTNFVDKFHSLSVVEKAANELNSGTVKLNDASESLYKKARLFTGTPKKAELVLKDLKAILKPLSKFGYTMKDLGDYAAAKHAKELEDAWKLSFKENVADALLLKQEQTIQKAIAIAKSANQNTNLSPTLIQALRDQTKLTLDEIRKIKDENRIESGFNTAQIKSVLQKYDTPEMKAIQKRLVTYNSNLLDMLVNGKLLTQKAVDSMRGKYPNYVPFYRFFEDDIASGFGGKGFANITSPVKRLKGSTRDIIDPLESMIKNTFAVVNAVEKNKVGLELAKLSKVEGIGGYIEKLDGSAQVPKENIVTVFENGEKVQYQLDPELYRSIQQLDEDTVNHVIRFLSYPSSLLRAGATLTPEFILRNPIRDQFQAFVVSNYGYNPLIDLPLGIMHVIGRSNTYKQWISENGSYGGYLSQDRNYLREQLQGLKDERSPWAKATTAIVNPKQWLYLLRLMGEITEEGTKVGEFRNALKKGATPQEAAYQSRDLMDFGRVGNNIRQVNRIVTFLNANIQGKDRIARAFKNNPIRTTIRAITALTLPTIGIYMWNKHNSSKVQKETLDNAPQWLRDTFFLISVPGTDVVARIPKPFDLAPIFSSIPENIMRFADKNDPQSNGELAKGTALSLLKIPYMITGLTPLIENATNYSFFTGAPVIPKRDQDLLPEDQYGVNTSLTARAIGKVTKTPPYKVDHLIRGYGAGLGRYATSTTDKILEKSGVSPLTPTEEKKISELPVINAFTVDSTGGGKLMDDFYTMLGDMTAKAKSNDKHQVIDGQVIFAQKRLQAASTSIGKLRATYRDVQGSYKLTPKQKRIELDKLDVQMNNVAKQTMAMLEKVKTIKQKAK